MSRLTYIPYTQPFWDHYSNENRIVTALETSVLCSFHRLHCETKNENACKNVAKCIGIQAYYVVQLFDALDAINDRKEIQTLNAPVVSLKITIQTEFSFVSMVHSIRRITFFNILLCI